MKIEMRRIPSTGRKIRLLILHPKKDSAQPESSFNEKTASAGAPGVLWIHGGGYLTGFPEMVFMTRALSLAKRHGAVVVAPAYRLSGEAPYPAALEDCFAALLYMKEHALELGIRTDQIMVGGESAGGGLTAALCLYARDEMRAGRESVNIAYQMPLYPMLDCEDTESSRDNHAPVWNTRKNHAAWKLYLRGCKTDGTAGQRSQTAPAQQIPPYASPARAVDHTGLPPAYTFVGDIEPFYCETLTYVENLKKAGVEATVDVYPKCFHAFDMMLPFLKVSLQAAKRFEEQFAWAKENCFAPQDEDWEAE